MNNQVLETTFILLFQLAGGIAIGVAFRNALRRQISCAMLFFVVWGFMFGGVPIGIGWQEFAQKSWLLPLQIVVFIGAILTTAFLPDVILDSLKSSSVSRIIMGGLFGGVGVILLISMVFDQTQLLGRLLTGSIFTLAGAGLFWSGFRSLGQD